jgi:hypothetical protein
MTRAEIKSKFDEIVAFAEVEKFLDTPVNELNGVNGPNESNVLNGSFLV